MSMLSFESQGKILGQLLQKQTNKYCADCGSHSPTWASLDFGVFVCSNCSGAHRALGPTITRIKSTKLDQWNTNWISLMPLGNLLINKYWQADSQGAKARKPKYGASLDQHNRYVVQKYVRKKWVSDKNKKDPLTLYRNGESVSEYQTTQSQCKSQKPNICNIPQVQHHQIQKKYSQTTTAKRTNNFDLLNDFSSFGNQQSCNNNNNNFTKNNNQNNNINISNNNDQDQFTDYVDSTPQTQIQNNIQVHNNAQTNNNLNNQINNNVPQQNKQLSFDDLLKSTNQQSQQNSQQFNQFGYNMMGNTQQPNMLSMGNGQQNMMQQPMTNGQINGYSGYNQYGYMPTQSQGGQFNQYGQQYANSSYNNQFSHNPYIGYQPHNQIHASYNYNNMGMQNGHNQFNFN